MKRFPTMLLAAALASPLAACQSGPKDKHPQNVPPLPAELPAPPPAQKVSLDPKLQDAARKELLAEVVNSDPFLRSNAIEALADADRGDAAGPILTCLKDPNPSARFAAAVAAGQLELKDAYQPLLAMADDPDLRVQAGVRFALHKLGDTHLSHQLEKLAADPDPHVRATTAEVLGLLGDPSAGKILTRLLADPVPVVRIQAAEGLWRLGNEQGRDDLIADTISKYPDDQIIAVIALAEPGRQEISEHCRGMLASDYEEVSLAAARAMGMLGSDAGYAIAVKGAKSTDPRQRLMAAMAMGAIGRADLQPPLAELLKDTDPSVRIAAATAILQLHPPVG